VKKTTFSFVVILLLIVNVGVLGAVKKYFAVDQDTYIDYTNTTTIYGGDPQILLSQELSTSIHRNDALFKATSLNPALPEYQCYRGKDVFRAKLWVYQNVAADSSQSVDIYLGRITEGSWDESTATQYSVRVGSPITWMDFGKWEGSGKSTGWTAIDIIDAVRTWFDGAQNKGLILTCGTGTNYLSTFDSSETINLDQVSPLGTRAPFIEVEFHNQYTIAVDQDSYIDLADPMSNAGSLQELYMYYSNEMNYLCILMQATDLVNSLKTQMGVADATTIEVVSAELRMYHKQWYKDMGAEVYVVKQPWDEATVTFATQPLAEDDYDINFSKDATRGWAHINVSPIVHAWVKGTTPNYGVYIKPHPDSRLNQRYYSSEYTDTSMRPFFVVTVRENPKCCGQEGTVYMAADSNKDCAVDIYDFKTLAEQWLNSTANQ